MYRAISPADIVDHTWCRSCRDHTDCNWDLNCRDCMDRSWRRNLAMQLDHIADQGQI